MKISDQLKAAKAIIASPSKWTQGVYAKNSEGDAIRGNSDSAICFCSLGALQAVNNCFGDAPSSPAISVLRQFMGGDVSEFNDSATHEQVMEAWDKAIAAAEKDNL